MTLKFSFCNSKINALAKHLELKKTEVVAFDLPAGYTCPCASLCRTYANRSTGKITQYGEFKCYASMIEARYPAVRALRWNNFDSIAKLGNDVEAITALILESIPNTAKIIRIHSSGDFFSYAYFQAWLRVAQIRTDIVFFGYSKILAYALTVLNANLENFKLEYSYGGTEDAERDNLYPNLPTAFVRTQPEQYNYLDTICCEKGMEHQDFFYIMDSRSFVLNVH